ncbi:MAG: hypothetical protein PHZ04_00045 [Patescibacteria group bacterium]|nr:hypothetical protein [Patescibacteria group bacterium]MDD5294986.1 hypothetical protein [Patescibacteria group bacterium]MDD5554540.1 hypothetical protein [Patescibacteria group bacterium]
MSSTLVVLTEEHYDAGTDTTIPPNVSFVVKGTRGTGNDKELCCGGGGIEFWVPESKTKPA